MKAVNGDGNLLDELFSYLERDEPVLGSFETSDSVSLDPTVLQQPWVQIEPLLSPKPTVERASATSSARDVGVSKRRRDANKVKELEALAAAKAEQFAALVQRNAELKFKDRILSDAVLLRDLQLRIARTGVHPPSPCQLPSASAPGAASVASIPGGRAADAGTQPWQTAATTAQAVRTPYSVRLLCHSEMVVPLDVESLLSIGRLQLLDLWKDQLAAISVLLLTLDANPDDEDTAVKLHKHLAKVACLLRQLSVRAPETMMAFMQTHIETGAIAAPPSGHWLRVLQALELTPEQVADLRAVYSIFSGIMAGILDDRRTIKAQMCKGLEHPATDPRVATAQITVSPEGEALPALERSMRKESAAHLLVRGFVFGRTLSMLQFCRAGVHSYPFFPSATGLAAAAAGVVD